MIPAPFLSFSKKGLQTFLTVLALPPGELSPKVTERACKCGRPPVFLDVLLNSRVSS